MMKGTDKPVVIWLTGLSGAGKSTIAQGLAKAFQDKKLKTYVLDGDILRSGINKDLGFDKADRVENIRRTGEVAKLMVEAGISVIAALISPYAKDREGVRALFGEGQFIEVFVSTPIELCKFRDPKGLYAKVSSGEIKSFTGIDAPYEEPINPEITLNTEGQSVAESVKYILNYLN